MTSRERIENVLAGKPVDRRPVVPLFMRYSAKMSGIPYSQYCRDYKSLVAADLKTYEYFRYDMVSVISDAFREAHDLGAKVEFPYDGVPYCDEKFLKEYTDIQKVKTIDPLNSERMRDRIKAVELFRQELGDSVSILGWVEGALAEASDLRGVEPALMDTIDNPDFLFELLEKVTGLQVNFAQAQIEAGADWIGIGESVGSLVSKETYQKYAFPYLKRIIEAIHDLDARARLHICGDITHLLDLISALNVDILDLDWMVDIGEVRRILGSDICLAGKFDPVTVLEEGTPEIIKNHVKTEVEQGGEKFMICPGCEVTPDTPFENLMAFCPG